MKSQLHLALLNDLNKVNINQDSDYDDYFDLTHNSDDYPFATVAADKFGTYSVYIAINDVWKGIALEDERPYRLKQSVGGAITAIRELQHIYGNDYPGHLGTWEGKNRQVTHHNQHGQRVNSSNFENYINCSKSDLDIDIFDD